MAPRRPKTSKNPPIFSSEFIIQNHADIVSCVAMVFVVGLMFQVTNPVASMFVMMQYKLSVNDSANVEHLVYSSGSRDLFSVFFYFLISIVVHAVIQEYVLDKLNRKMHLSKIKHSKFNESGQLLIFYLASTVWGIDMLIRESVVTNVNQLWEGYPHTNLPFSVKLFFIVQIAYWVHNYPELYFQKVRKEELAGRLQYISLYLFLISAAYFLNFSKVALCLLVLHYAVEFLYHLALLCHFSEKTDVASSIFLTFDVLFVIVRLGTITLAVLTFWFGLPQSNQPAVDVATGNYNTNLIRVNSLVAICLSQAGLMWNFITFHLRKWRERSGSKKTRSPIKKKTTVKIAVPVEEIDLLPEVDQNAATENGAVRPRKVKK